MKAHGIEYSLARRRRRTVEIAVKPDGRVEVAAPLELPVGDIDRLVEKRAGWIRRKRAFFGEFDPRRTPRRFVAGETHLYLGKQYRLRLLTGKAGVSIDGDHIVVSSSYGSPEEVAARLDAWSRKQARAVYADILDAIWPKIARPGLTKPSIRVQALVRRWGSLSENGLLTLNLSLIQAPKACVEYVIAHELCHLDHPGHGPDFISSLAKAMPDWENRKRRLEKALC